MKNQEAPKLKEALLQELIDSMRQLYNISGAIMLQAMLVVIVTAIVIVPIVSLVDESTACRIMGVIGLFEFASIAACWINQEILRSYDKRLHKN
jgi:hypothetical protein